MIIKEVDMGDVRWEIILHEERAINQFNILDRILKTQQ